MVLSIQDRKIGHEHPIYFIADIGANHDGNLERAKYLIRLAANAGADAAKFQNFRAPHIVSKKGFESLGSQLSHQKSWKKPVYEAYKDASLPWEWTAELKAACDQEGVHYLSTPYDLEAVDMLEPFVPAYKIGSGDIDWLEELEYIAKKQKPVILSTGAATMKEVDTAVQCILSLNKQLIVLQCNTNYTGHEENFRYVNLRVLNMYRERYPQCIIGLSDHTSGHAAVIGAVTLGARVIEKHFTDDRTRDGPDHPFAMDPPMWKEMVKQTRYMEQALGDGVKRIEDNEKETVFIQRRCLLAARSLPAGSTLRREDIVPLRPAVPDAVPPSKLKDIIGTKIRERIEKGDPLLWKHVTQHKHCCCS